MSAGLSSSIWLCLRLSARDHPAKVVISRRILDGGAKFIGKQVSALIGALVAAGANLVSRFVRQAFKNHDGISLHSPVWILPIELPLNSTDRNGWPCISSDRKFQDQRALYITRYRLARVG